MITRVAPLEPADRLRDDLEQLVDRYRHLHEEHRRSPADGRVRRRLERRLDAVAARFERRLRSVTDEAVRAEWRRHLYQATPAPAPAPLAPAEAPPAPDRMPPIEIVSRGTGGRARQQLRDALTRVVEAAPRTVVSARGSLRREPNPSLERPVVAEATISISGTVAHGRARGHEPFEAIDLLLRQLLRTMRELRARDEARRRGGRD